MQKRAASREIRAAVLGAGIMGASVALFLARKGVHVTLLDSEDAPFCGASRWNEGKIHLGYLYANDPSKKTARGVLSGGLSFKNLTEELIGCPIEQVITPEDDIYLAHRDSVVGVEAMGNYFREVTDLVHGYPQSRNYLVDVSGSESRMLTRKELGALTDSPLILAGYRVPERSVETNWIADRFIDALSAEPRIERALATRVKAVKPAGNSSDDLWSIDANPSIDSNFNFVINALWHGRIEIDSTVGLSAEPGWSHRYRLSLFVHTARKVDAPSAVLATGPFGDVKNYNGQDFYLSWYPTGLLAEGHSEIPPVLPCLDNSAKQKIAESVLTELGQFLPAVKNVAAEASTMRVGGGWVFASGKGSLSDPKATVHQRDRFGIRRLGTYISVDTGKYSSAPWLARQIAEMIC